MPTLINLALAVLGKIAGQNRRREFLARLTWLGIATVILTVGAGFLIAASYLGLADRIGPPLAAAAIGLALCLAAAVVFLVVNRRARRNSQMAKLATAAAVPAVAMGGLDRRNVQAIFDEFRRILDTGGSLTAAFFFVGLSAGLLARWLNRPRG
jgi:hypothetical protein